MSGDGLGGLDGLGGPRVAPDHPPGSGDRSTRIAIAFALAIAAFILTSAATVLILWVL